MPINLEFDSLEGLPDSLKGVLVEREGKYVLEGETPDEVRGLRSAFQKQQEQTKKLSEDLKRQSELYKDLDPEKAREALKQLEELEEKGLRDSGKTEELFEKRFAAARDSWEREKLSLINQRDQALEAHKALEGKYQQETISTALREAMAKFVKPEHYADVENRLKPLWRFTEQGELLPLREGKEGPELIWGKNPQNPITMEEQIETLIKDVPVFSLPSSGGGAVNGGLGGRPGQIVLPREQAKDAQAWRAARAQAEKTGATIVDEHGNRLA